MNNRLYEYMRLGKEEDEKIYKEELFDTKKIVKLTDKDIARYNAQNNQNAEEQNSYLDEYNEDNEYADYSDSDYYEDYQDSYQDGYIDEYENDGQQSMQDMADYGQDDNGQYNLNMDQYIEQPVKRKTVNNIEQPVKRKTVSNMEQPVKRETVSNMEQPVKRKTVSNIEQPVRHEPVNSAKGVAERSAEKVRHYNNYIANTPEKQNSSKASESLIYHYRSPFRTKKNDSSIREKLESKPSDFNGMDGNTMLMGFIGESVSDTLLPWIHREIALVTDYNYSYNAFKISQSKLGDALTSGTVLGIKGFNIGDPYREEIIPKLKAIGKSAYLIGYVNTLVAKEDGYYGFNTEVTGIKRTLLSDGTVLKDKNVLITGTANMINSIILAACELEAENIFIITSEKEKISKAAGRISAAYSNTAIHILDTCDDYMYAINQHTKLDNFKLIAFYAGGDMPNDVDLYERIAVGYDISYDVFNTKFTNRILESGGAADNGLKMFIYRALSAYELWSGKKSTDEMAEYINKKLKKKLYK